MIKDATLKDPSDVEDIDKVREFLTGNAQAFEFLFDKYHEKVFGVAFRFVKHKEDALEITQEVFIRVYQGLSKFKTDSKFFTWLYRITVNRSIDFLRSKKARPTVNFHRKEEQGQHGDITESIPNPKSTDPSKALEEQEMADRLMEAVALLSSKHQSVFILHAVEQLSYKDIGEVLNCSIGTVMSRLYYARKKLQQYLTQTGYIEET